MSARRFSEWQAYCSLEPFGPVAEFWQAAMIASMIANVNRGKGQRPFSPEDFMPSGMVEKPTPSGDQLAQRFRTQEERKKALGRHG